MPQSRDGGSVREEVLRKLPLFQTLDRQSLRELASGAISLSIQKGEELFEEGAAPRGMYVVLSGSLKIYRASLSGREQILSIETAGSAVAELPLLDGGAYPASCAALEACELLLIPRDLFQGILRRQPDLALKVIQMIGLRLRRMVSLIDEISLLGVPERLAKFLLDLHAEKGTVFTLPYSNIEIASRIGTVRELVSRNLHRLADEGVIAIDGRTIRILDPEALRRRIDEAE